MSGHHGGFDARVGGGGAWVDGAVEWGGQPGGELDVREGGEEVDVGFGGVVGWEFGEEVEVERHCCGGEEVVV